MNYVLEILVEGWAVLMEMAPYLLFGFIVAGFLSVLLSPAWVERHLGGKGFWSVLKASLFGVPLPLCSCGVIPVSASLHRHGASKGATASFLLSTPQTGVDSILVTYGLLGGVFALFRPVAALISGVVGGTLVSLFDHTPVSPEIETAAETVSPTADPCTDVCCSGEQGEGRGGKLWRALRYGLLDLPRDIGPTLVIGLLLAGLISALMPDNFLAPYLGGGLWAILALMLLGLPVYVCATASVPVAFMLVVDQGVSPGAAFAFLVTGPATNAATIAVLWRVLGRRTALVYLATVAATAVLGGLLLDQILSAGDIRGHLHEGHWMLPAWLNFASAVGLLALLAYALATRYVPRLRKHETEAPTMSEASERTQTTRLSIEGMTCGHCAASVKRALTETPGVDSAEVNLPAKEARVTGRGYDVAELRAAVESLGYRVVE